MQRENQIRRDRVPLLRPYLHLALPFLLFLAAMVSNMAHRELVDKRFQNPQDEQIWVSL
jgi:hypothetical protein